jgi:hypothetical protein
MFIQTCSLGCSSGQGGSQVSCTIVQVALDNEIAVLFSEPVDPASVDSTTFQLIDVGSGQVPVGARLVDASNPRKMIFRPTITFDSQGTATFGFTPNTTYRITVPGTNHNDLGPFVKSLGGGSNQSRMQCDIQTTNQVDDLVPGPPHVHLRVDLAIPSTPDVNDFIPDQEAAGALNVWRNSTVRFIFNDIMNPVTLANPITHQASLITIKVDSDGDLGTTADQVTLFGNYVVQIDLNALQTVMTFTAANGMPSSGDLPTQISPRKILVNIPSTVQDLAGNGMANPGTTIFTPEIIQYPSIDIPDADGENFTNTSSEDQANSGADWGQGRVTLGWGGGSGRLGSLRVPTPQTVTLDTDGTMFKNLSAPDPLTTLPLVATSGIIDNSRPTGGPAGYEPLDAGTWPTVTVTDGIFEFSSLTVESGAVLKIVGTQHVRLFSRGTVTIDGAIDIRGEAPAAHASDTAGGEMGGNGGPNAGEGGKGGDRADNTGHNDLLALTPPGNAITNPGAFVDGTKGGGIGRSANLAAGSGGRHYPNLFPTSTRNSLPDRGGLIYTAILFNGLCTVRQVSSPGGGGAYGIDGGNGAPQTPDPDGINPTPPPPSVSNLPTSPARGGDSALLGIEPPDPPGSHIIRTLDAANYLRGGSGGGGGGTHLYDTDQLSADPSIDGCYNAASFFGIEEYFDHSGGGGGGGGGALQLVSGEVIRLRGVIAAQGGDGGNNATGTGVAPRASRAAPGGAGSGGAVRLQATVINIDGNSPGRINVSGGLGGVNISPASGGGTITLGQGGSGGSGLIRVEDLSGGTSPPATLMTRCSEAFKILPFDPTHIDSNTTSGPCHGLPEDEDVLSVGIWGQSRKRPESFSGAVSCWVRPPGNFFTVNFNADDLSVPTSPVYGWNMQVVYDGPGPGGPILINYRGPDPNSPFGSGDFETNLGSVVNYLDDANPPGNQFGTGPFDPGNSGSYLAVRFQGALAIGDISGDPCNVQLAGVGSQIAAGSLTPWVRHPSDLNLFQPRPNMIRFCVVFDRSLAAPNSVPSFIRGVTNLIIHAQPD